MFEKGQFALTSDARIVIVYRVEQDRISAVSFLDGHALTFKTDELRPATESEIKALLPEVA